MSHKYGAEIDSTAVSFSDKRPSDQNRDRRTRVRNPPAPLNKRTTVKYYEKVDRYVCFCSKCSQIAGLSSSKSEAVQRAHQKVKLEGWKWTGTEHEMLCATCLEESGMDLIESPKYGEQEVYAEKVHSMELVLYTSKGPVLLHVVEVTRADGVIEISSPDGAIHIQPNAANSFRFTVGEPLK